MPNILIKIATYLKNKFYPCADSADNDGDVPKSMDEAEMSVAAVNVDMAASTSAEIGVPAEPLSTVTMALALVSITEPSIVAVPVTEAVAAPVTETVSAPVINAISLPAQVAEVVNALGAVTEAVSAPAPVTEDIAAPVPVPVFKAAVAPVPMPVNKAVAAPVIEGTAPASMFVFKAAASAPTPVLKQAAIHALVSFTNPPIIHARVSLSKLPKLLKPPNGLATVCDVKPKSNANTLPLLDFPALPPSGVPTPVSSSCSIGTHPASLSTIPFADAWRVASDRCAGGSSNMFDGIFAGLANFTTTSESTSLNSSWFTVSPTIAPVTILAPEPYRLHKPLFMYVDRPPVMPAMALPFMPTRARVTAFAQASAQAPSKALKSAFVPVNDSMFVPAMDAVIEPAVAPAPAPALDLAFASAQESRTMVNSAFVSANNPAAMPVASPATAFAPEPYSAAALGRLFNTQFASLHRSNVRTDIARDIDARSSAGTKFKHFGHTMFLSANAPAFGPAGTTATSSSAEPAPAPAPASAYVNYSNPGFAPANSSGFVPANKPSFTPTSILSYTPTNSCYFAPASSLSFAPAGHPVIALAAVPAYWQAIVNQCTNAANARLIENAQLFDTWDKQCLMSWVRATAKYVVENMPSECYSLEINSFLCFAQSRISLALAWATRVAYMCALDVWGANVLGPNYLVLQHEYLEAMTPEVFEQWFPY
ncbi:hypothetical protein LPJ66_001148 [Kickxella alabastrina]|uniref:Uncharacterized protein n=1 Tax=Kickxella alabastrina TaxID=61397 RepID=A0ACC1ITZ5_9FUNG|nr:hypothetical protein LPJ66_001148 [Kickxella alabastrina]